MSAPFPRSFRRAFPLVSCSLGAIFIGLSMIGIPSIAASGISIESRTYLHARGVVDESSHLLLYEYLALDAEDILGPGLFLRAGGWGRTDLADETFDRPTNGDLQYAFLGWRAPHFNAEARIGRLSLTAGVARNEVFDGLLLGSDLPAGFDFTLFGGLPLMVDEKSSSGDSLYGARVSQGRAGIYRLGVSYLKEQDGGNAAREEAGSDLFLSPLPLVEVAGTSLYNVLDNQWARHDYRLALGPFFRRLRLRATWASTDYRHYFTALKNPAFSPVREEKLARVGGEAEFLLGRGFRLTGEYAAYRYELAGDAAVYGARLDWSGSGTTAGGGYRQVRGAAVADRYRQLSAYATQGLGPFDLSAGVEHLAYEAASYGLKDTATVTLGLGYRVSRSLELAATAEYGQTFEADREIKSLLAVLWRYDATIKKGGAR